MGPIIIMIIVIVALLVFGMGQIDKSNRLKREFGARLHSVGIHQYGLPQVSEGKIIDVLLGNEKIFIKTNHQIFELYLHKVRGIHSSIPKNRMTSKSVLLTISYDMNGRFREIGIVFMKPSIAKQFLGEIEGRLFTTNSRNGVTRL